MSSNSLNFKGEQAILIWLRGLVTSLVIGVGLISYVT